MILLLRPLQRPHPHPLRQPQPQHQRPLLLWRRLLMVVPTLAMRMVAKLAMCDAGDAADTDATTTTATRTANTTGAATTAANAATITATGYGALSTATTTGCYWQILATTGC